MPPVNDNRGPFMISGDASVIQSTDGTDFHRAAKPQANILIKDYAEGHRLISYKKSAILCEIFDYEFWIKFHDFAFKKYRRLVIHLLILK